jgi:hypothetical protein
MINKTSSEILELILHEKYNELENLNTDDVMNFIFEGGNTLLHYSAQHSLKLCMIVLPKYKDINVLNSFDRTPLHYCLNSEIRRYLIQNGMCY